MRKFVAILGLILAIAGVGGTVSEAFDGYPWAVSPNKITGPLTLTQNGDTFTVSGDGSDWLGIPSQGGITFRSTYLGAGNQELAVMAETYVQPTGNVTTSSTYAASSSKFYWDTNYSLSGGASHAVGALSSCENTGTGTLIRAIGNESKILASNASGDITSGSAYWAYVPPSSTGTIDTFYGLYYQTEPAGTITKEYCIYNAEPEASINTTGKVAIGKVTQPTYDLELVKANTDGSNRPQMQFYLDDVNVTTDQSIGDIYWYNADPGQDQPTNVARISAHSYNEFGFGSYFAFSTHDGDEGGEGSAPVERLRIGQTGALTSTQNLDSLAITGNGTDWYIAPSDGALILQTAETNTDSILSVLGNGTGDGVINVYSAAATDLASISNETEAGLTGGRLTLGVDEGSRIVTICDIGDVGSDLGLTVQSNPALYIFNAAANAKMNYTATGMTYTGVNFTMAIDKAAGETCSIDSSTGAELTDDNADQAWLYIEPKINQTSTAAYNAIEVKVTETGVGSGATGLGAEDNFLAMGISTNTDMFRVNADGEIWFDSATGIHANLVTITAGQGIALRATPITIIAAQGANTWIEVLSVVFTYDYAAAAFGGVGADEDIMVEYANGTNIIGNCESTGFIDQTDDEIRWHKSVLPDESDVEALINQGVRVLNEGSGEWTGGGTSEIDVRVTYIIHTTGF